MKNAEKIQALDVLLKKINPTIIYDEGWMIRLLVLYSVEQKITVGGIDFGQIREWTSEAQISSPFSGPELKAKGLDERGTHTDIMLGDFEIDFDKNTGITIQDDAKIAGIIEAKMNSNLSQGVKNAENYNQISRSVSCLAYNAPANCKIFVLVVAPQSKIDNTKNNIAEQVDKETVEKQIANRLKATNNGKIDDIVKFNKNVKNCDILIISFEEWIEEIKDENIKKALNAFYDKCKKYNKVI
jgi:hypothetical protein